MWSGIVRHKSWSRPSFDLKNNIISYVSNIRGLWSNGFRLPDNSHVQFLGNGDPATIHATRLYKIAYEAFFFLGYFFFANRFFVYSITLLFLFNADSGFFLETKPRNKPSSLSRGCFQVSQRRSRAHLYNLGSMEFPVLFHCANLPWFR
jgi:hypothetical protein